MAEPGRPRYRRWVHPFRDNPPLQGRFDVALVEIGQQITAQQSRLGYTQQQLVDAAYPHVSLRGLRNILKAKSDLKLSMLVRLAAALRCDVIIVFRPRTGSTLP